MGDNVEEIGGRAFLDCYKLKSITLPQKLKSISCSAFEECYALTSIHIPDSVEDIVFNTSSSYGGGSSFRGCRGFRSITVSAGNKKYDSRDNCNAIIETSTNTLLQGCDNTIIPNTVTSIGDGAFSHCDSLRSIIIPESVTHIGSYAFGKMSVPLTIRLESAIPPECDSTAFELCYFYGIDTIYIPCGSKEAYTSVHWGKLDEDKFIEYPSYSVIVQSQNWKMGNYQFLENVCGKITIEAIPNFGYHFTQWSDGNTDNPRIVELTQDTVFTAMFAESFSLKCGENLYWSYVDDTLSITGTGDMYDYAADSANAAPWVLFRDSISEVVLPEGITYIGTHAFRQLPLLTEVTIPNAVEEIGESAFAECAGLGKVVIGSGNNSRLTAMGDSAFIDSRKLYEIHIAATEPPIADRTTFLNYNVHLYVPCESKDKYDLDMVFGDFKYIECLDTDTPVDEFSVTPAQTSAQFVWGAPSNAATYTLDLQQEDAPFFTLVFNATGQLQSISLAPIGSQVRLTAAEKAGNGFTFNATGLTPRTLYDYDLTIRDAAEVALQNYSGYFYTTSDIPTGTEDVDNNANDDITPRKVFRGGQVYILRNGKTYTLTGVEVE